MASRPGQIRGPDDLKSSESERKNVADRTRSAPLICTLCLESENMSGKEYAGIESERTGLKVCSTLLVCVCERRWFGINVYRVTCCAYLALCM